MSEDYNREDYDDIVDFLRHYARPYDNGKSALLIMEGDSLLEVADEIATLREDNENLRVLITAWADAYDGVLDAVASEERVLFMFSEVEAARALRKAIGR